MPNADLKRIGPGQISEINSKVDLWETGINSFLHRYDEYADFFRMNPPRHIRGRTGNSNTRVSETVRATEALSTSMFRMMTVADPFFELTRAETGLGDEELYQSEIFLRFQLEKSKYKRKLLKGLRGLTLFGTQVMDEPWITSLPGTSQRFQGTDFVPRSLLQFGFDPTAPTIQASDFHIAIDYLTPAALRRMAKENPDVWDVKSINNAIDAADNVNKLRPSVIKRLERAGYGIGSPKVELVTFYGHFDEGAERKDGGEWVVSLLNGEKAIRAHGNPWGRRPFRVSSYVDFELEPLGYGVGKLGFLAQRQLDANRNRVHDLITFGLYNMFLVNRSAGIRQNQFRIRPNGVIEADDITDAAIRPLRPSLEAANQGVALDRILKEELMGATGATANLQALTTDATATEASLAQNEAIRRVSVHAELVADDFVRDHILAMNEDNFNFIGTDEPGMFIQTADPRGPRFVHPLTMAKEIDIMAKTTTDKDFRPKRITEIINLLTNVIIPLQAQIPAKIDVIPVIKEALKGLGVNPEVLIRDAQSMVENIPTAGEGLERGAEATNRAALDPSLEGGDQISGNGEFDGSPEALDSGSVINTRGIGPTGLTP